MSSTRRVTDQQVREWILHYVLYRDPEALENFAVWLDSWIRARRGRWRMNFRPVDDHNLDELVQRVYEALATRLGPLAVVSKPTSYIGTVITRQLRDMRKAQRELPLLDSYLRALAPTRPRGEARVILLSVLRAARLEGVPGWLLRATLLVADIKAHGEQVCWPTVMARAGVPDNISVDACRQRVTRLLNRIAAAVALPIGDVTQDPGQGTPPPPRA